MHQVLRFLQLGRAARRDAVLIAVAETLQTHRRGRALNHMEFGRRLYALSRGMFRRFIEQTGYAFQGGGCITLAVALCD